jgi:EmrB/QacA subfamily drug resistance transporter
MEISNTNTSRKWYVMAAVSMGKLLATIDSSIVNVALPTLVREFKTDFPTIQWVVLGYLLTLAVLLLSIGRLADMIGKKKIYTTGFAIFTISSALCGLSWSVYALILFRILQAVGATMVMALGMAIIVETFPPRERGMAIGIGGTMVSIGIVIGPTLGGLILDLLSWNWIFYVNVPVGILGILMVLRFVPDITPVGRQRFDYKGAITLFISLLAFLLALTFGQNMGFANYRTIILFVIWGIFLGIFIVVESHEEQPMIDLSLFRNNLFRINLITGFLTFVAIAGTFILIPFFLENILHFIPRQVGLLVAVIPATMGVVAPIAGSLSDRFGTRIIAVIGLAILLFAYSSLSTINIQPSSLSLALRLLPIGLGMGIFQSPNNSAIMGAAPPDKMGLVSGMLSLTRTLGQSTGIAINGAIWAALTINYSGSAQVTSATDAPALAQVSALQNTFVFVASIICFALLLAIWAVIKERKMKTSIRSLDKDTAISD